MNKDNFTSVEVNNWIVKYFLHFKDGAGVKQKIEIPREIYDALDGHRKQEESLARKDRKYIEQSDLSDQTLYERVYISRRVWRKQYSTTCVTSNWHKPSQNYRKLCGEDLFSTMNLA